MDYCRTKKQHDVTVGQELEALRAELERVKKEALDAALKDADREVLMKALLEFDGVLRWVVDWALSGELSQYIQRHHRLGHEGAAIGCSSCPPTPIEVVRGRYAKYLRKAKEAAP